MEYLTLFSFILNNFQEASIRNSVVFHCWQNEAIKLFAQRASSDFHYTQFVDITKIDEDMNNKIQHKFLKYEIPKLAVFIPMNCAGTDMVLNACNLNRLYNDHYHWLLYDPYGNISEFRRLFEHSSISVNSDFTYVIPSEEVNYFNKSSTKYFIQYDVYNNGPHIGGKLNMTIDREVCCTIDRCYIQKFLSKLHKRTKYGNRNRQSDINLRLGTIVTYLPLTTPEEELVAFLRSEVQLNIDSIARFGFQQISLLIDMLQCNVEYRWLSTWSVNESHGGIIGALKFEEIDISSSNLAISLSRRQTLIPLVESSIFHSVCMFRTPLKTGLRSTGEVYFEPFSRTVWIVFVILIIIGALQLWGIFFIEYYKLHCNNFGSPTFFTSFLITFGTVCAQGTSFLPKTIGGRLSYSALVLASFIMYNYYTSIIVSTLLGAPTKSNIKTLAALADSSLEVGFEPIPFNFAYFNASMVPAVRRLVERKIQSRKDPYTAYIPATEGLLRMRNERGTFAYIFEGSTGFAILEKFFEADEICDLNEILTRPDKNLNNVVHKNSSFIELFRLRLLRIIETGVNRRNVRRRLRNRLYCFRSNKIISVGLNYTAPLFFILLLGAVLAFICLYLERFWYRFSLRKY